MTTEEFSNGFDVLLNSYFNIEEFGKTSNPLKLDEYEKSVLLTKAQEEIVLEYYTGKNSFRESFEQTEEIRRYLSTLIKTQVYTEPVDNIKGISDNSNFYTLPEDLLYITYESVKINSKDKCMTDKELTVLPITQDTFSKIKNNPFKNYNNRRVLRLDYQDKVELISKYKIKEYLLRYLSKPSPIILVDLSDDLTINNSSKKADCLLHPALHESILNRAIELAIRFRIPQTNIKNK